jgi:hypothetical protein
MGVKFRFGQLPGLQEGVGEAGEEGAPVPSASIHFDNRSSQLSWHRFNEFSFAFLLLHFHAHLLSHHTHDTVGTRLADSLGISAGDRVLLLHDAQSIVNPFVGCLSCQILSTTSRLLEIPTIERLRGGGFSDVDTWSGCGGEREWSEGEQVVEAEAVAGGDATLAAAIRGGTLPVTTLIVTTAQAAAWPDTVEAVRERVGPRRVFVLHATAPGPSMEELAALGQIGIPLVRELGDARVFVPEETVPTIPFGDPTVNAARMRVPPEERAAFNEAGFDEAGRAPWLRSTSAAIEFGETFEGRRTIVVPVPDVEAALADARRDRDDVRVLDDAPIPGLIEMPGGLLVQLVPTVE